MVDRSAYLARIRYQGSLVPSMETLRGLHLSHVLTVPFENLDIHLGRPISLDPSDLSRKIVISRRGGYCFELNGLFALLLEELGFVITRLAARVLYGTEGVRPRSHQVLLVHLDGERWIVDVGFGGQGLREPLHRKAEARAQFDQAVAWMYEHDPKSPDLLRLRQEAATLLGRPAAPADR